MPMTLANIDNLLKVQYLGVCRNVINFQARTVKACKPGTKTWSGKEIQFPFHSQRSNAVSFGIGGEDGPTAQYQQQAKVTIPLRQMWGFIRITKDAISASRDRSGAFEKAVSFEMEGMTKEMVDMAERSIWGDGTGKIGEVESYNAGTLTVTTSRMSDTVGSGLNGNADNRYIRVGQVLDFYTSGSALRSASATVASVNLSNGTFVLSAAASPSNPAAGDGIYIARPSGSTPIGMEPMGIPGIIDDGTYVATIHGVVRATYPIFNAQIINAGTFASPGAFQENILQRAFDAADEGSGMRPKWLFCHHSVRQEVVKQLVVNRRYMDPLEYQAGFKEGNGEGLPQTELSYNGVPFMVSKYCPWGTIFGWNPNVARFYQYQEPSWVEDGNGGVLSRVPSINGTYEAQMWWPYNVSVDDNGPNSSFAIRFISATVDRVTHT